MKPILYTYTFFFLFYILAFFAIGCDSNSTSELFIYSEQVERIEGTPREFEAYELEYEGSKYIVVLNRSKSSIAITSMASGIESTPNHQVIYPR